MSFYESLRDAARKRAAYRNTVSELRRMPDAMALDLGLYKGDAHEIARRAVYGA